MRDLQRPAECRNAGHPVVGSLGRVLTSERKWPGIKSRIVERQADPAVIQSSTAKAIVAERRGLPEHGSRSVVRAAVDQKTIGGALAEIVVLRGTWRGRLSLAWFGFGLRRH